MKLMTRAVCRFLAVSGLLSLTALPAGAQSGVNTLDSDYSVAETRERLLSELEERGLRVFVEVDHAANAEAVDIDLRGTHVVVFGNPVIGSRLMVCDQQAGLDLPLKALIHEDDRGGVLVSWHAPDFLGSRYDLADCRDTLENMDAALRALFQAVTSTP